MWSIFIKYILRFKIPLNSIQAQTISAKCSLPLSSSGRPTPAGGWLRSKGWVSPYSLLVWYITLTQIILFLVNQERDLKFKCPFLSLQVHYCLASFLGRTPPILTGKATCLYQVTFCCKSQDCPITTCVWEGGQGIIFLKVLHELSRPWS